MMLDVVIRSCVVCVMAERLSDSQSDERSEVDEGDGLD